MSLLFLSAFACIISFFPLSIPNLIDFSYFFQNFIKIWSSFMCKKGKIVHPFFYLSFALHEQFLCLSIPSCYQIFYLFSFQLEKLSQYISFCFLFFSLSLSYIYIYIYCHPQTDRFIVSQFISLARHARCFKLGLKPGWLYRSRGFCHTAIPE